MSRACPELKTLALGMDAQPITLEGQVLRMISINCIIDNKASKLWIQWYLGVCTKLQLQCVCTYMYDDMTISIRDDCFKALLRTNS